MSLLFGRMSHRVGRPLGSLCGAGRWTALPGRIGLSGLLLLPLLCGAAIAAPANSPASLQERAAEIFRQAGISGGLVVHVRCGDGRLTAALRANDRLLVQGLDTDPAVVAKARDQIRAQGLYGQVTIDHFSGTRLPYVDNLVNLIVAEDLGQIPMREVLRVLCPNGVALIGRDANWAKTVKPRPAEIDQWTHYLHDASNDAVSHDTVVAPPRRLQWVGRPRWTRHHDRMSGVSAVVSAGGRVFSIIDEAPRASILIPPAWQLVARDAFNGTLLWKRPITHWHTHLWPLKSGPAQLPRRLVADGDRVYVTLRLDGPVVQLDAATGATTQSFKETEGAEEIILTDGLLLALVNQHAETPAYAGLSRIQKANRGQFYDEKPRRLVAIRVGSGAVAWAADHKILPVTLAADPQRIYFHDGTQITALDKTTGNQLWQSDPIPRADIIQSFFAPTLVVHRDVVLFAGGETAGQQTGSWYMSGKDTMTALSATTGKTLWSAYHPPSGYRSAEDLFAIKGTVWTGETTSGRAKGWFTGRDLHTGEVLHRFAPDVETYWFHHRCYRGKATDNFLLTARTGTEFIDIESEKWLINDWVRGACLYGIMPANGLLYAPPHPCACYLESKLNGFNALAPAGSGPRLPARVATSPRLEKGPAFSSEFLAEGTDADWPTYRHDVARSGATSSSVPAELEPLWQAHVGGKLTSPVIAGTTAYVAAVDDHRVVALDARSGSRKWQFTAGGRIDSPPTIYQGRVLFGSADGYVYCLHAADGLLVWRFRAAPAEERLVAYDQVESVWPVPGNVMVLNDVLYCVAGRSMFLDGGLRLWRLDPKTGCALSETVLGDRDAQTGKPLQDYVSWLNMPTAMPDILSSDGRYVYMRSQPFQLDGTRLPLRAAPRAADADQGSLPAVQNPDFAHLFCPTGFCDDSYWHRSYWLYGSTFVSGWSGYYRAGKTAPAGKILCFDKSGVYGFGRQPKYFRWTTPIEYQLFAAKKVFVPPRKPAARGGKQSFVVKYRWTKNLPVLGRALAVADGTIFVAGPPDLVDEPEALRQIDDPQVQAELARQSAAIEGKQGGTLWAIAAADGTQLARYPLDSPPIFDGLAAAQGRLYMSTSDGRVVCFAGK